MDRWDGRVPWWSQWKQEGQQTDEKINEATCNKWKGLDQAPDSQEEGSQLGAGLEKHTAEDLRRQMSLR